MGTDLAERVTEVLLRSERALSSGEIAARLGRPRAEVEAALDGLRGESRLLVREWPMADPHFGADQIVVAARVEGADDPEAVQTAEERCQQVYDGLLLDFLASHRCV